MRGVVSGFLLSESLFPEQVFLELFLSGKLGFACLFVPFLLLNLFHLVFRKSFQGSILTHEQTLLQFLGRLERFGVFFLGIPISYLGGIDEVVVSEKSRFLLGGLCFRLCESSLLITVFLTVVLHGLFFVPVILFTVVYILFGRFFLFGAFLLA